MPRPDAPRIAVAPSGAPDWMTQAVYDGGGHVVDLADAEGLIWASPRHPDLLPETIAAAPHLEWVQLPFAGIENFVHLLDTALTWTCGKGVYADPVAELALTLGLAGLRGVGAYTRAQEWTGPQGRNLIDGRVTILGGGGIAESLIRLLQPFECHITVVRRSADEVDGADDVLEADQVQHALPGADLVVLALALTPETEGLIGIDELGLMEPHAWLVNVARGRHVVTDDLVTALREGMIGGAGLDVTDPEPLPSGHPLFTMPNCIVTPHVGNTPEMAGPLLRKRIAQNVKRFGADEELLGLVDVDAGY